MGKYIDTKPKPKDTVPICEVIAEYLREILKADSFSARKTDLIQFLELTFPFHDPVFKKKKNELLTKYGVLKDKDGKYNLKSTQTTKSQLDYYELHKELYWEIIKLMARQKAITIKSAKAHIIK